MIQVNDEESLFYFFFFSSFGGGVSLNGGANLFSGIGLSVNLWNVALQASLVHFPGKNIAVGHYILLLGIFPVSDPTHIFSSGRRIIYHLSHL